MKNDFTTRCKFHKKRIEINALLCSTGEVAYESPEFEQGVFSYFLCDALAGKAASDDGNITIERLVDYVKIGVKNWCDNQMKRQTPHVLSDISGSLILTKVNVEEETTDEMEENNPLAGLLLGLDTHIREAAPDIQNLTLSPLNG